MGIPSHTRIVVVPSDERPAHEYGITRPAVIALLILSLSFTGFLGVLMHSFATKHDERQAIHELERQLAKSQAELQIAHELAIDLEAMRESQEQLLLMLGVRPDSTLDRSSLLGLSGQASGSATESMRRAAAITASPRPKRWPANGFVTKEFIVGNASKGIKPHLGIDIAGPVDAPVVASAAGIVARAGIDEFLGNYVEIQHGMGYITVYGHCSRVAVSRGDRVAAGQVIAYVGQTGKSSAPHLHFEVWEQGEAIDPRKMVAGSPKQK